MSVNMRRLLWFAGLWLAGFGLLAMVAYFLRWIVRIVFQG